MKAAAMGVAVYGLTVGVGWNKDRPVFQERDGHRTISDDLLAKSRVFNLMTLRSHAAGYGPELPEQIVRAAMMIRLKGFLTGAPGVQPAVVEQYRDLLNAKVTPAVPS
jgi:histidine ammonia-lyase